MEPLPRKRDERKKLDGYACDFCQDYYDKLGLSEEELKQRMKCVSRHRGYKRPKTPDNFWELEFPDNEECVKRGYCDAEPEPFALNRPNKYKDVTDFHGNEKFNKSEQSSEEPGSGNQQN